MEGFDIVLINSLMALPAFQRRFGEPSPKGGYQISAAWQSGLSNGALVGEVLGLFFIGYIVERIGYKKTMIGSLALLTGFIFIVFFAQNLPMLLVGEILMGIPWSVLPRLKSTKSRALTVSQGCLPDFDHNLRRRSLPCRFESIPHYLCQPLLGHRSIPFVGCTQGRRKRDWSARLQASLRPPMDLACTSDRWNRIGTRIALVARTQGSSRRGQDPSPPPYLPQPDRIRL